MALTCLACNGELAPGAKFCRHCGAKVEAAEAIPVAAVVVDAPAPAPGTCPACNGDNLPTARFCRHCGGALPEPVAAKAAAPDYAAEPAWDETPPPRRPVGLYVLGGIAALAVLGAAGWFGKTLIARDAPTPATTGASAVATAAVVGPFETIKFERIIDGTSIFSAFVTAKANPTEIYAEGQRYCAANAKDGCAIILVAAGRTFPSKEFLEASGRQTQPIMDRLMADGSLFGVWIKKPGSEVSGLVLNCSLMTPPSNQSAIFCDPRMANADASAMPAEEAVSSASDAAVLSASADAAASTYYLSADANLRAGATVDSANNGKLSRGTMLSGAMIIGDDGKSSWLKLAGGKGYVSAVNLSANAPPQLSTIFGARTFKPDEDLSLYAGPDTSSALVDTIPAGTAIVITGITGNGFVEAKGRRGGVGYFPSAGHNLGSKR